MLRSSRHTRKIQPAREAFYILVPVHLAWPMFHWTGATAMRSNSSYSAFYGRTMLQYPNSRTVQCGW